MELDGSSGYVKLSARINTTVDSNGRTSVRTFCNNPRLLLERAARRIAKYLSITSAYMYLPGGNRRLSRLGVVYRPDK